MCLLGTIRSGATLQSLCSFMWPMRDTYMLMDIAMCALHPEAREVESGYYGSVFLRHVTAVWPQYELEILFRPAV